MTDLTGVSFEDTAVLRAAIDRLLGHREALASGALGEWRGGRDGDGTMTIPYFARSEGLAAFVEAAYAAGWVEPFDWGEWQDEAARYVDDPGLLGSAGVETIRRLLTIHIRKDRFVEGHLVAMVAKGHIVAILERLAAICRDIA